MDHPTLTLEVALGLAQDLAEREGVPGPVLARLEELLEIMADGGDRAISASEVAALLERFTAALAAGDAARLKLPPDMAACLRSVDIENEGPQPVDVSEFVESARYMGQKGFVRPRVLEELHSLFHGPDAEDRLEVVLGGAIGWGKSYFAEMGLAYMLYRLSRHPCPQLTYGLAPGSSIVFIMQSLRLEQAKKVLFQQFGQRLKDSPYFQKHFRFDKRVKSELRFPGNVQVIPVSSSDTAAIGMNVFAAVLDEVNFMARSQRAGEDYDQAERLYTTILRRMKSRYNVAGRAPGKLFLISSANYPGDFIDRKMREARAMRAAGRPVTIHVAAMSQWEAMPPERLSKETFLVEVGDDAATSRLLQRREDAADPAAVIEVPMDYYDDFARDLDAAIRDLAGIPVGGVRPFLRQRERLAQALARHAAAFEGHQLFARRQVELGAVGDLAGLLDVRYLQNHVHLENRHALHADLALTGDSAGLAVAHVGGLARSEAETPLPWLAVDGVIEVVPPPGDEIDLNRVAETIETVARCLNLCWITADSYQSASLLQRLRKARNRRGRFMAAGVLSVDTSLEPYLCLKEAVRDGRILLPEVPKLSKELAELTFDPERAKVDHPPGGSKDLADAVAGASHVAALHHRGRAHGADNPGEENTLPPGDGQRRSRRRRF